MFDFTKFEPETVLRAVDLNRNTTAVWDHLAGSVSGMDRVGFVCPNYARPEEDWNHFSSSGACLSIQRLFVINDYGRVFRLDKAFLQRPERGGRHWVTATVGPWEGTRIRLSEVAEGEDDAAGADLADSCHLAIWKPDLDVVQLIPPFTSLRSVGALHRLSQEFLMILSAFENDLIEYARADHERVAADSLLTAIESCRFLLLDGTADAKGLRHAFYILTLRIRGFFARTYAVRHARALNLENVVGFGPLVLERVLEAKTQSDRGLRDFLANLPTMDETSAAAKHSTGAALADGEEWRRIFREVIPRKWIRRGQMGQPRFVEVPRTGWKRWEIEILDPRANQLQLRLHDQTRSPPIYQFVEQNEPETVTRMSRGAEGSTWDADIPLPDAVANQSRRLRIDFPDAIDLLRPGVADWSPIASERPGQRRS